jgi:hypothetical protein
MRTAARRTTVHLSGMDTEPSRSRISFENPVWIMREGSRSACSSSGSVHSRLRTVWRRIYAAHLTVSRRVIEQLEQVEIDAFPTEFITDPI